MLNKLVNKIKKLIITVSCLVILLVIASPYAANFYVEKQYYLLANKIAKLHPNIVLSHNIQRNYLNSKLITKIQLNKDLVVLEHNIKYVPFYKKFYKHNIFSQIQTKILSGLPGFIHQEKALFALTTVDFEGCIKTITNPVNLEYIFDLDDISSVSAKLITMHIDNYNKNIKITLKIPNLMYIEDNKQAVIDDLKFNLKINNNNIKLIAAVDRVYIVKQLEPILRLVGLKMEQNLTNIDQANSTLNSDISFLKLNMFEQKFGPLATKWQLNNINLPTISNNFNNFKLPIITEQYTAYKFIEIGNKLLQYQPKLSLDLLLNTNTGKLKILTDFATNTKDADWFSKDDILDSIQANVAANVPRKIFFELISFLMEEKLKKEHPAKHRQHPKEFEKQLQAMVIERVNYLLKNHIIREHESDFVLDLSIAEGTFYSRTNPFKLFSF